jgi:steroid delta-isomerase-like uncharacterized protein
MTTQITLDQSHTSETKLDLETHKQVVRQFLEATHSGNLDVIDTLVAPTIVTHNFPGEHNPASREEYKTFFRLWGQGLPKQQFEILAMVAEGDRVAVHFSVAGQQHGELMGIPATGRLVTFTGMVIYRMAQGQIAETWLYPDSLTLLAQLGVLPAG